MSTSKAAIAEVKIAKNGPYLVSGNLPLAEQTIGVNSKGESVNWIEGKSYPRQPQYALCRCGHSAAKPFCDGSHANVKFDGTETASREPYRAQAKTIDGPSVSLSDAERLCAFARFCDPNGQVWNLVLQTDDPRVKSQFVKQVGECPSGRLVAQNNPTARAIEPMYAASVGLIQDPSKQCSGPIWMKGVIQLTGADGFHYEIRNRETLCRCGASKNKPFCDGTHAAIGFQSDVDGSSKF